MKEEILDEVFHPISKLEKGVCSVTFIAIIVDTGFLGYLVYRDMGMLMLLGIFILALFNIFQLYSMKKYFRDGYFVFSRKTHFIIMAVALVVSIYFSLPEISSSVLSQFKSAIYGMNLVGVLSMQVIVFLPDRESL